MDEPTVETEPRTPTVVVATDGTARSGGATRYAVHEARRLGAALRLVHVVPVPVTLGPTPEPLPAVVEAEGRRLLAAAAAAVRADAPDLDVTATLRHGPRTAAICGAAEDAVLLVVGRETRSGLERLVGGTTTAKVAAHADVRVAVVAPSWRPAPVDVPGRVVVGVRSRAHAADVLGGAFAVAAERGASLLVVHAWSVPEPYAAVVEAQPDLDDWVGEGARLLEEALVEWRTAYPQVDVEVRVAHARAAAALLDAAAGAGLLLLPRRGGLLHRGHLGGTAREVLAHCPCPVEVLPVPHADLQVPDLALEDAGRLLR